MRLLVAALISMLATSAVAQSHEVRVTAFKDGDTFVIDTAGMGPFADLSFSVRVASIDTPEKGKRAKCRAERDKAAQAAALTRRLIEQSGDRVFLSDLKHDAYGGRIVATVRLRDGRNLSDVLVRSGLAKPYDGKQPKPKWC